MIKTKIIVIIVQLLVLMIFITGSVGKEKVIRTTPTAREMWQIRLVMKF